MAANRLKILLVARRSAPATGGVESYLRELSRGLAGEHAVTLLAQRIDDGPTLPLSDSLCPPPSFEPFSDEGVRVVPLRFTRSQRLRMLPTGAQVVPGFRRYAYGRMRIALARSYASVASPILAGHARLHDVVHVWGDGFLAAAGVRAGRLAGVPVLITPFVHRGQWGDDPASALAYRQASRVIALLEHDRLVLAELGVPSERLAECPVCTPGVRPGGGSAWRRTHRVDGPLVVFLGVRRPYKGFDVLLDALEPLGRLVPSVTVAFAGPGPPVSGAWGLRVIDRGVVSEQERAALLDAADVLCLPSAGEIFPVSILEAWSARTAVLTSDIPPLAELMRRSGGGVAVPRDPAAVAAGLASILAGGHLELAESGHRYWRSHATVDAVVSRHLELYRGAIEEHRLHPAEAVAAGGAS